MVGVPEDGLEALWCCDDDLASSGRRGGERLTIQPVVSGRDTDGHWAPEYLLEPRRDQPQLLRLLAGYRPQRFEEYRPASPSDGLEHRQGSYQALPTVGGGRDDEVATAFEDAVPAERLDLCGPWRKAEVESP